MNNKKGILPLKIAVIGIGNMGSQYAPMLALKKIVGLELAAITRIGSRYIDRLVNVVNIGIPVYHSADELFTAVEEGKLSLDAVLIATPHYSHRDIALRAFQLNLHVLCDKPAGVYSRQAREMSEAAQKSGRIYSLIFNQRALPIYQTLHDIVNSGIYGRLKRVNWTLTNWYRPDAYYTSVAWRGSWNTDGGGILLNQYPHHLDLLQWICGMPEKVQGFCREGQYHPIEVEDDVTAYFLWKDGASGVFIASNGDAPGVNRLEISLDQAMIICENDELRIGEIEDELGMKEAEYRHSSTDLFRDIKGKWKTISFPGEINTYMQILQNFSDVINGNGKSIISGRDGINSLVLSNAIYLSSWQNKMVEIPGFGTEAEAAFEREFEQYLFRKRNGSKTD